MKAALLAVLLVAAVAAVPAGAHPEATPLGPGLHRICTALGVCRDIAPRPGPMNPCNDSNVGAIEQIWDARLGAWVEWQCRGDGHWYRLRIVPDDGLPWTPSYRMEVVDATRACEAIFCIKVWRPHWYPTRWAFGR